MLAARIRHYNHVLPVIFPLRAILSETGPHFRTILTSRDMLNHVHSQSDYLLKMPPNVPKLLTANLNYSLAMSKDQLRSSACLAIFLISHNCLFSYSGLVTAMWEWPCCPTVSCGCYFRSYLAADDYPRTT